DLAQCSRGVQSVRRRVGHYPGGPGGPLSQFPPPVGRKAAEGVAMKRIGWLAWLGLFASSAVAADKHYTFALVPKLLDNPVFGYAKIGAEKRAKALGNVTILWRAPQEADAAKQVEILEGLIALHIDG